MVYDTNFIEEVKKRRHEKTLDLLVLILITLGGISMELSKFDDSLLKFMKTCENIDCLLDIEGNNDWVEVSFHEDVIANRKKERYTPKWDICFHNTTYEYRDSDYSEDAFVYLNNHWIPGVSKLKVQTYVEVKLNDSEMPRPSVNIPLDPKMFNRIRNTTMTEEQKVGLEAIIRDYMDKISSPDTKKEVMKNEQ